MARKITLIVCLTVAALVAGCCCAPNTPAVTTPRPISGEDRLLGVDMTLPADNDFARAYDMARDTGVRIVQITPAWDDIEPAQGQYKDPQDDLASAKAFYSHEGLRIALAVSPLDTNRDRRPPDLREKPFDDPGTIDRYDAMLDDVLSKLDGLALQDVAIGNEVDVYLGNDAGKWEQYTDFYRATKDHLKADHPGIRVGVKATFDGLTKRNVEQLKRLNGESDVILVTYYPLNPDFTVKDPSVVRGDFNT
ncbi:MAG TPA: hypothetical protein VMC61_00410, partial [Methanocella sp.]|nr:hypothetical protein [Methanocella sp.]